MSATDAIALGLGAAAAAEATGVTNFTGDGQQGDRGDGGLDVPEVPTGLDPDTVMELVSSASSGGSAGASAGELADALSTAIQAGRESASGGSASEIADQLSDQLPDREDADSSVPDWMTGDGDPPWETDSSDSSGSGSSSSSGGSSSSSGGSSGGGGKGPHFMTKLVGNDKEGVQPGDVVAAGFEAAKGAGEAGEATVSTAEDGIDTIHKTGRTIREAGELALTGKADTSGTLAKDRGKVGIDFNGDGSPGGPVGEGLAEMDPIGEAAEETGRAVRNKLGGLL